MSVAAIVPKRAYASVREWATGFTLELWSPPCQTTASGYQSGFMSEGSNNSDSLPNKSPPSASVLAIENKSIIDAPHTCFDITTWDGNKFREVFVNFTLFYM